LKNEQGNEFKQRNGELVIDNMREAQVVRHLVLAGSFCSNTIELGLVPAEKTLEV